ncbi:hypothetical protein DCAR_0100250 [Daucus carota subsp. sativus]|uniref:Uncharacterized protein n=1 Tax=Daucus carota subsp. sativus TaxID=79200 RepID=A0AAF1AIA6_DAUCS|nr:hypothetical protein DCAR_0100250 [Daucus carota subsp. sativus]
MPPSRGADRIGVSLGSHRPTVILKLPCLVEKTRTKVRSLVVDTGKTQPDDVCWLVVRGLLVPAYPKGGAGSKTIVFFLLSLSSGKGVYLSA